MKTINCKGSLIDLGTPRIMGIINVTPDSFYDGGKTASIKQILPQAETMLEEGATFLDIGGYSSRPGASHISAAEECSRVTTAVDAIARRFPEAVLSIDTFRSEVARAAVEAGAAMVNDISAGVMDETMLETVAELQVPYIAMHMRGTPQTMQENTQYDDVLKEVLYYFSKRLALAREAGIVDVIADPGFGFAKDTQTNFQLLQHLEAFQRLEIPILVGISRKSMIYKTLKGAASEALNGTTALHAIALYKGANILRVHDVKEAVECAKLVESLKNTPVLY